MLQDEGIEVIDSKGEGSVVYKACILSTDVSAFKYDGRAIVVSVTKDGAKRGVEEGAQVMEVRSAATKQ